LPFLVLPFLLLCFGCRPKSGPKPPDLSACTRLEVHDPRGVLNYVVANRELYPALFNRDEIELLQSFQSYVIDDPETIDAFARGIGQGIAVLRPPSTSAPLDIQIVCYRGDERVASLQASFSLIKTEDGRRFKYANGVPSFALLQSRQAQPFRMRLDCASRQSRLRVDSLLFRQTLISYPDPNHWCDLTADVLWRLHGDGGAKQWGATLVGAFTCPAAREKAAASHDDPAWVSDYAMNPYCRPGSPVDTVLLFETKPGWNQHGGPELFSFDNHDPNGGCVLLNDGTIKFIRTKEELAQLRWKP
jgi:hypothetical protein